mmetsp:Transcript_12956/g.22628  ORF Transcript_12956/g.22628 Transcript_12956/m.22628 type:complete len:135 (-) Transcript_12956:1345-1749(-)
MKLVPFSSLFIVAVAVVVLAMTTTLVHGDDVSFRCEGICGEDIDNTNPEQTVTYSWNSRVPVGSSTVGETEQTQTCNSFESQLYSFEDPAECAKHQAGIIKAGCTCEGSAAATTKMTSGLMILAATWWCVLVLL